MASSRRVLEALFSGCLVYGLMAACSSSSMKTTTSTGSSESTASQSASPSSAGSGHGGMGHGGNGGAMGMGGMMGTGGTVTDSGIMDVLTDPVPNAEAGGENPTSGSRLKGKYMMGSDGSKEYQLAVDAFNNTNVHAVWHDSMLNADCSFFLAADGNERCLPGIVANAGVNISYADDQCTQPLFEIKAAAFGCSAATPPAYALMAIPQPVAACSTSPAPAPVHVYQSGAMIAKPMKTYLIGPDGMGGVTCYQGDWSESYVPIYFQGTEIPASTFVQGTTGIDP